MMRLFYEEWICLEINSPVVTEAKIIFSIYLFGCIRMLSFVEKKLVMKKKNKSEEEVLIAREEMTCYQHRTDRDGVTRMISQSTLEEECISLAESKKRIIEKVHNHFRNV